MRTAADESGYRTKHYQLTHGSLGCYMSHLQLYQHILRSGACAFQRGAVGMCCCCCRHLSYAGAAAGARRLAFISVGHTGVHLPLCMGASCLLISMLPLQLHVLAGAQYAFVFEDDAMLQPHLLAAMVEAKPFPGEPGVSLLGAAVQSACWCPRWRPTPSWRRTTHSCGSLLAALPAQRSLQRLARLCCHDRPWFRLHALAPSLTLPMRIPFHLQRTGTF